MTALVRTRYECQVSSADSIDHFLIALCAALNDVSLTTTFGAFETRLIRTSSHAWSRSSERSDVALGIVGAVRMLAQLDFLGQTDVQQAQAVSWMEATEQNLLSIWRARDKRDDVFVAAVDQFIAKIDQYLMDHDQTWLVGDTPTAADVVVACSMAAAMQTLNITKLPQSSYRWAQTTLHQLQNVVRFPTIPGWMQFGINPKNILQLWMNALEEGEASTKSAPKESVTTSTGAAVSSEDSDNPILARLTQEGIPFEHYTHALSHTAEELVANVPIPEGESHTKNLFLRDKKHGLFLITVLPETVVNTKELGNILGLSGKVNLRLADEAVLMQHLKVKPGCVGPLCIMHASGEEKITLVLDQGLLNKQKIHTHPMYNDQSVKLNPQDLLTFFKKIGVEPTIVEFTTPLPGKAPSSRPPAVKAEEPAAPKQPKETKSVTSVAPSNKKQVKKGETLLALQWKKDENFAMWYSDVIVLSEMIAYYDISGCYILRPWSYKIWELIQDWFNEQMRKEGVENAYFPLFVSKDRLEKEKDHVEGFAPEVAWVTKSGSGDLAKPIAVRPTSETIMYPAYSDWIRSHRDLPLKLNQWSNVVRWEFKYPTPFLRTREFLWQEGHTAHSTFEDADRMVMLALDWYRRVYEELLAVPVVPGYKTEKEKFAGGFRTTTVEAYIAGSGRAIQGATSHNLGQNFGKMFDINFQDENGETQVVWQTSWGLTTRTIGVMVMVHGDDTGLVLPPRIAPLQVVIVPIISKKLLPEDASPYCNGILQDLERCGIRAKYDDRTMYNPGWKYNHWEQKGVPIRIEVGPRDIEQRCARIVLRHDGFKDDYPVDGLGERLKNMLDNIQQAMFEKAKAARDSHIVKITDWKDFVPNLEQNNLVLTPWCGGEHKDWEEKVKEMSREESLKAHGEEVEDEKTATSVAAKSLCIPFEQPELPLGTKCIASGMDATCWVLWGRSY